MQSEQFSRVCLCEICIAARYSIFDIETLAEYPSLVFEGRVENTGLSWFGDESADKTRTVLAARVADLGNHRNDQNGLTPPHQASLRQMHGW